MSARRAPAYEVVRAALEAQWDRVLPAFAGADPAAPTRCEGWSVRDLEAHLSSITRGLAGLLAAPAPERPDGGLALWSARLPELAAVIDGDARATDAGVVEAVAVARAALEGADPERLVTQRTGSHRLGDAVLFRLIEWVVHGLDLPEPAAPDPTALKVVVKALAGLLAERAPGGHVEVRVPPYAAVQCVAGPRHTRGTPPNVVEVAPVPFVELCAGRLSWPDAVADGRVRTAGDRANLSAWLPLLA